MTSIHLETEMMSEIRKLASSYCDLAMVGKPGIDHERLHDLMRRIADTPYITWGDTKRCRPGISSLLRKAFPVVGFGLVHEFVPDSSITSARDAGDFWYHYASFRYSNEALGDVYGLLSNFCIALDRVIYQAKREADDVEESRGDFTLDLRKDLGVRRLCQFCWRPAENGRGATTCHRHSPFKERAKYMRARRHNSTAPVELKISFDLGRLAVATHDPGIKALLNALRAMHADWEKAVQTDIAQSLIDGLAGLTYKPLPPITKHKSWKDFHRALRQAFDAGPLPDDPDYTFAWLPYAIQEVKNEKAHAVEHGKRDDVLKLAQKLSGKRGWQSEIARQLGISRQRVSQILQRADA